MEWDEQRATAVREVERLNRRNAANVDVGIREFELANDAYNLYSSRDPLEQRDLLKGLLSNFTFADGSLSATWQKPFSFLSDYPGRPNENSADSDEQNRRRGQWSAHLDELRTFAADPRGWGERKIGALEGVLGVKEHPNTRVTARALAPSG